MTPEQILRYDVEHNQEGITFAEMLLIIKNEIKNSSARLVREGDTLIILKTSGKDSCEFHCFNADTPSNLAANVLKFLELAKKLGYSKAFTPYKNPAVSHLIEKFFTGKYKFHISETVDGFKAEVFL
jgi:hypothetical protein